MIKIKTSTKRKKINYFSLKRPCDLCFSCWIHSSCLGRCHSHTGFLTIREDNDPTAAGAQQPAHCPQGLWPAAWRCPLTEASGRGRGWKAVADMEGGDPSANAVPFPSPTLQVGDQGTWGEARGSMPGKRWRGRGTHHSSSLWARKKSCICCRRKSSL